MTIPNRIHRVLRKGFTGAPLHEPVFQSIERNFVRARWLVKLYYLLSAYTAYSLMSPLHKQARDAVSWDFLWPLFWMPQFDPVRAIGWLTLACFLVALLAFQFPRVLLFRLTFVATFLCVAAVPNSLGGINHGHHGWFWIGVTFLFLPRDAGDASSRAVKMGYLAVLTAAQALLLSFYTMAGLWKISFGILNLLRGAEGNLSPRGFALQLANRVVQTGTDPLLVLPAIDNYWLSWPMFLFVIYAQLTALFVLFRPRLHVVWGYILIGFHLGTWLLMEISFSQHVLFLLMLFVLSPFRPERRSLREAAADLPVFGPLARFALAPNRQVPRSART